jgi:hypothetical protein
MQKEGFKRAYYRGVPAYFNKATDEFEGRNKLYDILIGINIWFDINVVGVEEFPILVENDKEKYLKSIELSEEELLKVKNSVKDLSFILGITEEQLLDSIDIGLKQILIKKENIFVLLFLKLKKIFQKNASNRKRRTKVKSR